MSFAKTLVLDESLSKTRPYACIISHCIIIRIGPAPTTDYCDVTTGVHTTTLTFHRCRAGNSTGQYFTMNECPVGEIMNIQSAELGYSVQYNPNSNPPQCPGNDCAVSISIIDTPVRLCHGHSTCRISQEILIYPQGSVRALCNISRDGNFIRIRFTCVTGKISSSSSSSSWSSSSSSSSVY